MRYRPRAIPPSALILGATLWTVSCGSTTPTARAVGTWLGAQAIDGAPSGSPNCSPPTAPQVGVSAQGAGVATWLSDCQIWAARYTPSGGWQQPQAIGALPPGAPANWLWEPNLAVDSSGSAVFVWETQTLPSQPQIWARLWDAVSGWTPAVRIDGGEAQQFLLGYGVGIAMDPAGNAFVVWASQGIVAARFVAGVGWRAPERISGPEGLQFPAAFVDASGRAFALWSDLSGTAVVRRFEVGPGWEAPTRFVPEDPWTFFNAGQTLAFDPSGRALLLWDRLRDFFPGYVWSASFDGTSWTSLGRVSAAGVNAGGGQVGFGSDGNGLAVWGESDHFAFAHVSATNVGAPQFAVSGSGGSVFSVSGNGNALLAWSEFKPQQQLQGGGVEGIQRVKGSSYLNGIWATPQELQATANGAAGNYPAVAIDGCGNALVVWAEYEGVRLRVWANRFDAGCTAAG